MSSARSTSAHSGDNTTSSSATIATTKTTSPSRFGLRAAASCGARLSGTDVLCWKRVYTSRKR